MPRVGVPVDLIELQEVIDELENERIAQTGDPFESRDKLHRAVSQKMGISKAVVYLRIRDNGLDCKTPERGRSVGGVETHPARRVRKAFAKFDVNAFLAPFREQGIEIEGISSIVVSSLHTPEQNALIRGAWNLLRERVGAPPIAPRVGDPPIALRQASVAEAPVPAFSSEETVL